MKIIKKETKAPEYEVVEVADAFVSDMILAERVTGKADGVAYLAAIISQVATFDGKKLPVEEIAKIKGVDFFDILAATGLTALGGLPSESSPSAGKDGSDTQQ